MSSPTLNKTSTFTIHHDRCNPAAWTAHDILAFAEFVKYGSMQHAARLSKLGVQLVLSEHHEPKGGHLEEIGWSEAKGIGGINSVTDDISEISDRDEIIEAQRIYRGPVEYIVPIPMGDGEGNFEGYEYEPKATEAEAIELFKSIYETAHASTEA